jgi:two-component system response regulator (stage 0 sporulation protein A)
MAAEPDLAITKELYPEVAAVCGGDWKHVERTIRSAITAAWKKRDEEVWQQYFPPEPDGTFRKPTNGDFITRMAEALRMSQSDPR